MTEQRFTFDAVAADYDARRPDYPTALFDDLLRGLPADARVLEVGCGTGKATEGFARSGREILALDPGSSMLAQAQRRVAAYPNVRFVEGTFEGWDAGGETFELICAATSWHWVDPAVGYAKAAALLAPGGRLAIVANVQQPPPEPLGSALSARFAEVFERRLPDPAETYTPGGWVPRAFADCGLFDLAPPLVHVRPFRQTSAEFAGMAATFSHVLMLPPPEREAFLDGLRALIDTQGGGFETTLTTFAHLGRKRG